MGLARRKQKAMGDFNNVNVIVSIRVGGDAVS
jgi:hypothetical protein